MQRTILISSMLIAGAIIFQACSTGSASTPAAGTAPLYAVIMAPKGPAITRAESESTVRTEAVGATGAQPQATTTCSGIGTFSGREGNRLHGYSCTGVYFEIDAVATSTETTAISTPDVNRFVLFTSNNCTGTMYVATNISMSNVVSEDEANIPNGHAFRYDPTNAGITDASTYYWVPPGEASTDANIQSVYVFNGGTGGSCQSVNFAAGNGDTLYQVQQAPQLDPNTNSSAMDLPTAGIPGPVLIGTN